MKAPNYRVPSMTEIEALPWNGRNVVSTFSGCGGSCLGYRMAGCRVLYASEFIPAAQESYKLNHPGSFLDTRDIRDVKPEEILDRVGLAKGEIDIFDGSPPCSDFSTAGKRAAGWGKVKNYSDTKQRVDDLFFEYARILAGLQPKAFVAENVSGLVKGVAKGYFVEILQTLRGCGYRVSARVLDAQWLGVPQARKRLIFVGVREDLEVEPVHPIPLRYAYSIRDAIPWLDDEDEMPERECEDDAPCLEPYAIGAEWDRTRIGRSSDRYFQLVRPFPDLPSPTITQTASQAGAASVVHPLAKRKFSALEVRRLCGFPDDFQLAGDYQKRVERLGRAVPPVMMMHIARRLSEVLP